MPAEAGGPGPRLLLHDLLLRTLAELLELELDLRRRAVLPLAVQIGADLVDDMAVAALALPFDYAPRVSVGGIAREPHAPRRPQSEQPIASRLDLELQFLVVPIARLEFLPAIVE